MNPADDIEASQLGPDPDKLLAYHRQQLSAMLDGELSPDQAKFMLRRLQHDGELAACWDRWQVCGDMLRGTHHALLPSDFAARVAKGIAGDAPVAVAVAAAARPSSRRLRWGGGAALAASVALAAVFAPRMMPDGADAAPSPARAPVLAASSPVATEAVGAGVAVADAAPGNPSPATPAAVDVAPAVLATALAAAEAPRRAAERRARAQQQRMATASQQASAPAVAAGTSIATPAPVLALADPHSAFPAPAPLQPRPWPRAVLPGAGGSAFSVGHGQLPALLQPDDDGYDPRFLPRAAAPPSLWSDDVDGGRQVDPVRAAPVTP